MWHGSVGSWWKNKAARALVVIARMLRRMVTLLRERLVW